jgi:hypothetical protein
VLVRIGNRSALTASFLVSGFFRISRREFLLCFGSSFSRFFSVSDRPVADQPVLMPVNPRLPAKVRG